MDGYLKIKTKIDNKGIDKDITKLENKIKKLQTDNANASQEQNSLQQEINNYQKLQQQADSYRETIKTLNKERGSLISGGLKGSNVPKYNSVTAELEQMKQKYTEATAEIDKQAPKIEKVYSKLDKVKAKQIENNAKITEFKDKIEAIKINKVENQIGNIGKGIQSQIGKIGKMAMAVIGIRTAWGAVRSAISIVSQYNSQVSTDFEYMRYCIANALVPVVQKLISLLYTVLSYVNAITTAWFGLNLFSNSSVKAFQEMQNGAKGTAKALKEASKYTQGFDEMNIAQDNSSGDSGVSSGVTAPDLSAMQADVPKWLQWLIDNGEIARKILEGIATAILMIKFNLGLLQGLGIFMIIDGVVSLVKDLKTYLDDPTWENFANVLKDIAEIISGLGFVVGISNPFGIILAIIGQIVSIAGGMIKEFDALMNFIENPSWDNFFEIVRGGISSMGLVGDVILWIVDNLFGLQEATTAVEDAQRNLEKATKSLEEANKSYVNSVDKAENAQKKLEEAERKSGLSGEELFKKVQQGTLDYANMTAEQKEVYKAYLDNEAAQKDLKEATDKLAEAKKQEKIASFENKLATMAEAGQYDEYKKAVVEAFKNGELSADEARDLIGKSMSEMSRDSQKTFMEDLPSDIKDGLDPKKYESAGQKLGKFFSGIWDTIKKVFTNIGQKIGQAVGSAFKSTVNAVLRTMENFLNTPIRAINSLIGVINKVPGINLGYLNTFSLPRLAKGGVIAQPTTAIIGEAGKEAVVPLENNMEWLDILADKLANKIGNNGGYYMINMDGRVIQRGIAKRQQELAFAKNGR